MSSEQTDDLDHEVLSGEASCPNCNTPLKGNWCYNCGQSQKPIDRFFFSLVSEAFDDVFSWDSRTARTLFALIFRPGFLTTEYFAGRRARYLPPLRLYLVSSILFFFLLSLQIMGSQEAAVIFDGKSTRILVEEDIAPKVDTQADQQITREKKNGANAHPQTESDWVDDIIVSYDGLAFSWLSESHNQAIRERLKTQTEKAAKLVKEDPQALVGVLIDVAPPVMFVLLPIFALLLKLSYLGTGRYYTEHLILAVNNHSFLFLILIVEGFAEAATGLFAPLEYLRNAIQIWIPLYMFLSLKQAYHQGFILTMIKFAVLVVIYAIALFVSVAVAFTLGILTL
ncbi:MAG: DUF3667 domain-containing protein [Pseudomonadales bacterium]